jgi:hypothetical protein
MPQNPLTLTRQSLYELVWSTPMSSLAHDFGISDVALAKRCRAVDVPRYASHPASRRTGRTFPGAAFGRSDEIAISSGIHPSSPLPRLLSPQPRRTAPRQRPTGRP